MSDWTAEREAEVRARWFPKPPKDALDLAAMLDALPLSQYTEPVYKISMKDLEVLSADFSDALAEIERLRAEIASSREEIDTLLAGRGTVSKGGWTP